MTDGDLLDGFLTARLPNAEFRHLHHVRLAWIYLRRDPPGRAIDAFTRDLRRFATAHGAAHRYHETLTWAYLLLVHERMTSAPGAATSEAFVEAHPDLVARGRALLDAWYEPGTLDSAVARERFVLPDRWRKASGTAAGTHRRS